MDLSRYLGLFLTDSREHLSGLETDAVRLETVPAGERPALVDQVFRHLHSLKGAAATMGFSPVADLAHAAEELVGRRREKKEPFAAGDVDLLLSAADALRAMVEDLAAEAPAVPRPDLVQELARAAAAKGSVQPPEPLSPTSTAAVLRAPGAGAGPAEGPDAEGKPPRDPAALTPTCSDPHTTFTVKISPRSATPAARAFLALRHLERDCEVLATIPAVEHLKAGRLPGGRLVVVVRGRCDLEALSRAVSRVPEVDGLEPGGGPLPPDETAAERPVAVAAGDPAVRVSVELLDQLLELAGELVLQSSRLKEAVRALAESRRGTLDGEVDRLRLLVKRLDASILTARQTPAEHLAERFPRAVRDLSRRLGKPLAFVAEGAETTLDRGLADALVEPLLHVVRNAADHGIEPPEERVEKGKPAAGCLGLSVKRERDRVLVELSDDGRGFDLERLKARAVERGVVSAADAAAMDDETALELAFLPGVSTTARASELSGRGVGMDAVLRAVEQLGGRVSLESRTGVGSKVRFSLPATVSVTNLQLVGLGSEILGLPLSRVLYATQAHGGDDAGAEGLLFQGERIPSYALGKLLGLWESRTGGARPYLVVEGEGRRAALGVDRLLGQEEVVLRPLGPPLERISGLAGTTILGSGRPIFVLDVPRLVA